MRFERRVVVITPALVAMLALSPVCIAGVDKEQNQITAADVLASGGTSTHYAMNSEGKLFAWGSVCYVADSGLTLNDHMRSSGDRNKPNPTPSNRPHLHLFLNWSNPDDDLEWTFTTTSIPTVHEVNRYWDVRFSRCDRKAGPWLTQCCHEYAWANSPNATGTYTYMATGATITYVYYWDLKDYYLEPYLVAEDDILYYTGLPGGHNHSTLVMDVANCKPSKLRWKWGPSGVYEYEPPTDHEWDTPMCTHGNPDTDVETGKTPAQMEWGWHPDFADGPAPYTAW